MVVDDNLVKIVTLLTPVLLAVMVYLTGQKANINAEKAATAAILVKETVAANTAITAAKLDIVSTKADGVQTTLAQNTDATTGKLDTIHTLVNSQLTEALARNKYLEEIIAAMKAPAIGGSDPVPVIIHATEQTLPVVLQEPDSQRK